MPGNYKKLQAQITFDALTVHGELTKIPDQRRANAKYELTDFLCPCGEASCLGTASRLSSVDVIYLFHGDVHSLRAPPNDPKLRIAF